jgi:hypothetical protein
VVSKEKYGSLANALKAAQEYRKETLKNLITNEEYLKLRNQHKEKSAKEFSEYLRKETNFKPRRGDEFTREGVKTRDQEVKFETTRAFTKRTLAPKIEEEIYQKYLKAVKEGKREGTIVGLGREYLPGLTRGQQEKTISRILKEKGVDLSPFKKMGTGEKAAKQVARRERLGTAKKLAGSSAGQLSDEIILDIKAMNKKVADMPVEDIVKNKKYINSMRINATMDNLSKGVIPFDKYKDLSDLELANKIKDRAKANKFFDVEHISSVKGQKRNIYYPNNIQMAPGQFGSLMDNFKRIADEQPNNPVLSKVDKVLSDYNLTVRNPETKIRLGNKAIIEVSDGTSNIVKSNFEAVNTPFEKQTVTKPTPLKKTSGPTLGANLSLLKGLGTAAEVAGTPAAAALFAADTVRRNIREGQSLADAVVDPLVGVDLLLPTAASRLAPGVMKGVLGLGKVGRAFTPIGAALAIAGQGQEFYNQFQELQRLKEEDPEAYKKFIETRVTDPLTAEELADIEDMGREGAMYGGRVGFAEGPKDPGRRKFIKLMGILAALPYGIGKLVRTTESASTCYKTEGGKIGYDKFLELAAKIKVLGKKDSGRITMDRQEVTVYRGKDGSEYELTEDITTGDVRITKDKPGVRMAQSGDEVYDTIEDRTTLEYKKGSTDVDPKTGKKIQYPDEYEEVKEVAGPDGTFDDIDEVDDIIAKEIDEEIK